MGAGGDPEGEDQDHGEGGCDYHDVETADAVAEPAGYDAAEDTVGQGLDTKNAYFFGASGARNSGHPFLFPFGCDSPGTIENRNQIRGQTLRKAKVLRFQDEEIEGQEDTPEEEEATQGVEEESRLLQGADKFLEPDAFGRGRDPGLESEHGDDQEAQKYETNHSHYPSKADMRQ